MTALWTVRPRNAPIEVQAPAAGDIVAGLDFTTVSTDATFVGNDLRAVPVASTAGNGPVVKNWTPGYDDGRAAIVAPGSLPAAVPVLGGNALHIATPQDGYGTGGSGAICLVDLVDPSIDRNPDSSVVNEGIYVAGYDELWVHILIHFAAGFSWNGVSEDGWKQPWGFLIGPPKDTRWVALGSPASGSGSETADHGQNTGGHAGNGEWYSGGSTRMMSRSWQPAGTYREEGGIFASYVYHADQTAGGGYGDHVYWTYNSSGVLTPGAPGASNVKNPILSGGAAVGGEYVCIPEGRWVWMGQRCKLNTPGLFDGEIEAFIDGQSLGVQTGYRWRKSGAQNPSGLDAWWGIQAIAMYHFSGGATAASAVDASDCYIAKIEAADYDIITA